MLILNRRVGEAVMIADDIVVTVLGVRGNQVRLGLDAPPTVPIHREEVYERIQLERAASNSTPRPTMKIRRTDPRERSVSGAMKPRIAPSRDPSY